MEDRCAAERLRLRWNERLPVGAGLRNAGNTCFMNSVLQCLTYTPPLANYILSGEHSRTCSSPASCILCSLQKHITDVFANPGTVIVPVDMVSKLHVISEQFRLGQQEDAHEFFSYTVHALEQSYMLQRETKGTNLIKEIFGGCMRSRVKCLSCRAESDTFEPSVDVALDITEAQDLTDALGLFVRSERLDGYRCNRCMETSTASKTFSIFRSSNVLTICLKRFNFYGDKISKFVKYPTYLDMRPFMSDGGRSDEDRQTYKLYAVLVHSGSSQIGHYYCYVKAGDSIWYKINDANVSIADKQSVLKEQAYMLFYTRTTKTKALKRTDTSGESSGIKKTKKQTKRKRKRSQSPDKEESPPTAKRACKEISATIQHPLQEENKQEIRPPEKHKLERGSYRHGDGFDLCSAISNTAEQSTGKRKRSQSSDKEESPPMAKRACKEMPATLQHPLQEENKQEIRPPEKQKLERGSYRHGDGFDLCSVISNTAEQSTGKRKRSPSPDKEESPLMAKRACKELPASLQQPLQEENKQEIRPPEKQKLERGSHRHGDGFDPCSVISNTAEQSTGKHKHSQSSDKEESPPMAKQACKELQQPLQEENKHEIRPPEKPKLERGSYRHGDGFDLRSVNSNTAEQSTGKHKHSQSPDKEESPLMAKRACKELQQPLQEENKHEIRPPEKQKLERGSYRHGDGFDLRSVNSNTAEQSTGKHKHSQSSDKKESPPTAKQALKEMPAN